jgi:pectate lyase
VSIRQRTRAAGLVGALTTVLVVLATVLVGGGNAAHAATIFGDNFQDGNSSGWSTSGGSWSVVTDGTLAYRQANNGSENARAFNGNTGWTNYQVQARVKPLSFNGSNRLVGIAARVNSNTRMYRLALTNNNRAELQAVNGSQIAVIGSAALTVSTGTFYTLRIEVNGSTIRGFVNGTQVGSGTNSQYGAGRIGLATVFASAVFDDITVTDDGTTPPTSPPPNTTPPPTSPPPTSPPPQPPPGGLVGWATVNGTTTGGAGGPTVTVTSGSQLVSEMQASGARIIQVSGTLSISGMNDVASNKTLIGLGSNATITGGGLDVDGVSNVIIRNLNFRDWGDDAINVQDASHHIWIDHNSLTNGNDGAIDIKRESDFVTVSWNRIFGHDKSMLLGHDDGHTADRGHLRVTYHHNWFDGSNQRHPRVRYGNVVHVYNNFYSNIGSYGVASTQEGAVLVEANYFENTDDPYHCGEGDSPPGSLRAVNNHFVSSGSGQTCGSVGNVPYSYSLTTPSSVKSVVTAGAGAGRI